MTLSLETKLSHLCRLLRDMQSCLVAYSGGVDSALVAAVAHQELGTKMLACIGVSPSYPTREMKSAIDQARKLNIPHRLIETQEHLDPNYAANPANRCYFCKSELYTRLRQIANEEGWQAIADGSNTSDLSDDRPGRIAAGELQVRSPLIEADISKPEVRQLAKDLGLDVWDKPAMPCLSSRVPHGTAITPELLRQIESAEDVLANLGFTQFRVRHHGELARIELPQSDLPRAIEHRDQIVQSIRQAGYRHIALDLAGFQSGSFHVVNLQINRSQ